jgi:hypothetical protein
MTSKDSMPNTATTILKRGLKYPNFMACLKSRLLIVRKAISKTIYTVITIVIFSFLDDNILTYSGLSVQFTCRFATWANPSDVSQSYGRGPITCGYFK